jgi:hypothetical protein
MKKEGLTGVTPQVGALSCPGYQREIEVAKEFSMNERWKSKSLRGQVRMF